MSNFDNIPPVVFCGPEGTFTGAKGKDDQSRWDKADYMWITGEVAWGDTTPQSAKGGTYSIQVIIDQENFKKLRTLDLPSGKLVGLSKVMSKVKDADGKDVLDDEGEVVREFSHYQITVRQRVHSNKSEDGIWKLKVVDALDPAKEITQNVGKGSKVSVLARAYSTKYQDKPATGLNIVEVRVHELAEPVEGSGGGSYDDVAALIGLPPSAPTTKDTPKKDDTPKTSDLDDYEDDIPF